MNRENIKKWVDALRSGEYLQGYAFLRRGNSYCCLGVACELARKSIPISIDVDHAELDIHFYNGSKYSLPDEVLDWLGFSRPYAIKFTNSDGTEVSRTLADINDSKEYNFNQIADLIEKQFLSDPDNSEETSNVE